MRLFVAAIKLIESETHGKIKAAFYNDRSNLCI